jgi:ankyrin repeat protein
MYTYSRSPQILRYLALKQIKSRNSKDIFAEHSLRKYAQPILHTYMMHSPEGLALNKYPQNYAATTIPESTLEIGKILLKKGVPVDFMDSKKGTALQQSVFLNQPNAVQFLLQNGAKKDIPMPEFYKECATHLPLDCAKLRDKKIADYTKIIELLSN